MIRWLRSFIRLMKGLSGCWLLAMLLATQVQTAQVQAAPLRAELLAGESDRDWLLVIEADGELKGDELSLLPLLRQFAVGRVSISRVNTEVSSLIRWQIPLHLLETSPRQVPPLTLGAEQTPALPIPTPPRTGTLMPQPEARPSPVELQARVLHQGPLYPGQPFIYELSLWLPANMEAPNLGEPLGQGFTIRRLGDDRWESPASPGMPGRLIRKWLLQAREPGLHPLESPRFQGRLPQDPDTAAQNDAGDLLSARAATLLVKVDKASVEPVASSLILRQQFSPARGASVGEPVIRTLTLVMEGGDGNRLPQIPAPALPQGLSMKPDGEQQQERFVAKGVLRFERQWRQALTAQAPGSYTLPALTLSWFNTRTGRIEQARLPTQTLHIEGDAAPSDPARAPGAESLHWVLWALLLRALCQGGPRWLAFYRLQRALATREPDPARWALLAWAALRLGRPCQHLANLPCHGDPAMGTLLDDLDRACFAAPGAASQGVDWQRLAQSLCARETFAIAYVLRKLAWARP